MPSKTPGFKKRLTLSLIFVDSNTQSNYGSAILSIKSCFESIVDSCPKIYEIRLLYKIFYSSSGRLLCKSLNTFFIFYLPDSSSFLIISKTSSFLSFLSLSKDSGCLFGFCLIHCSIIKFVPISNNLGKIFYHSLSLLAILSYAYPCGLIN